MHRLLGVVLLLMSFGVQAQYTQRPIPTLGSLSGSVAGSQVNGAYTSAGMTIATARLLGRSTAGTGSVEEISIGSGLTLVAGTLSASGGFANPMTIGGDLIYGGASGVATRLGNGTVGQMLLSAGTTLPPVWTSLSAALAALGGIAPVVATPVNWAFNGYTGGGDPLSVLWQTNRTLTEQAGPYVAYGEFVAAAGAFATVNPTVNDPDANIYTGSIGSAVTPAANNKNIAEMYGSISVATHNGSGTLTTMAGSTSSAGNTHPVNDMTAVNGALTIQADVTVASGFFANLNIEAAATIPSLYGTRVYVNLDAEGIVITNWWGSYTSLTANEEPIITNGYQFYSDDLTGKGIVNPYYSWFDSQGVRRVKEDNTFDSVGQAIEALYNPQFTKYTAGAANFERLVLGQWNGNVAEIGVEKGGTGTLRSLRLLAGTGLTVENGSGTKVPVTASDFIVGSTSIKPIRCVSASASGALTIGVSNKVTATCSGATNGMVAACSPTTYPGDGVIWNCYVSASNTVTVVETGLGVVTPTATTYQVSVTP